MENPDADGWANRLSSQGLVTLQVDNFTCRNPIWDKHINHAKTQALQALGIYADCALGPPSLYMSTAPRSELMSSVTSVHDKCFAQLAITLPCFANSLSAHECKADAIDTRHSGHQLAALEESAMFTSLSVLSLQGVPITLCQDGGMLAVMTYPIVWKGRGAKPTTSASSLKLQALQDILNQWSTNTTPGLHPDYILVRTLANHHQVFDLASFDPDDRKAVQRLLSATSDSQCQVYLVSAMRETDQQTSYGFSGGYGYGREDFGDEEELESSYSIVDINGNDLLDSVEDADIDSAMHTLLGEDWDEDADSDSEDGDGFARKSYRRSAIIVIPDSRLSSFRRSCLMEDDVSEPDEQNDTEPTTQDARIGQKRGQTDLAETDLGALREATNNVPQQTDHMEMPPAKRSRLEHGKENIDINYGRKSLAIADLI